MTVIALCSASGSPGVTTTAVGLTLVWPRPALLVEADPSGSNALLAGIFRGGRDYDTGLLELAASPLAVPDALRDAVRPLGETGASMLVGTQSRGQSAGLRDLWVPLAEALADLERNGQDVIVDVGRLGLVGSPEPLLTWANLTLLVLRSHLPALTAARSWAEELGRGSVGSPGPWRQPGLLVVGEGQPYGKREIAKALGLPVVATIADDPVGAAVYHRGDPAPRRFEASAYVRSLAAAAQAITETVVRRRHDLTADVTEVTR